MTLQIIHDSLPEKLHPRFQNLLGKQFNLLTVFEFAGYSKNRTSLWKCLCDCGTITIVNTANLNNGTIKSCGCYRSKIISDRNTIHGKKYTSDYASWRSMINRCHDQNNISFKWYGKRGISVCDRWRYSFERFNEDMGSKPTKEHSIDRIDFNKNYEPGNCRWATQKEQANNKSTSRKFTYNGEILTVKEISEKYGIPYNRLKQRIFYGWDINRAVLEPVEIHVRK